MRSASILPLVFATVTLASFPALSAAENGLRRQRTSGDIFSPADADGILRTVQLNLEEDNQRVLNSGDLEEDLRAWDMSMSYPTLEEIGEMKAALANTIEQETLDLFSDVVFADIVKVSPIEDWLSGIVEFDEKEAGQDFLVDEGRNTADPIAGRFISTMEPIPDGAIINLFGQAGLAAQTNVESDGSFYAAVSDVPPGRNPYIFTVSYSQQSSSMLNAGIRKLPVQAVETPYPTPLAIWIANNAKCQVFVSFTLTWDGPTSDLDLYVEEPDGNLVWSGVPFGFKGTLDVEDNVGFGPENYFVSYSTGTKLSFRIRVNAFDLGDDDSTTWTVVARVGAEVVWSETGILDKSVKDFELADATMPVRNDSPINPKYPDTWSEWFELMTPTEAIGACNEETLPTSSPTTMTDGILAEGRRVLEQTVPEATLNSFPDSIIEQILETIPVEDIANGTFQLENAGNDETFFDVEEGTNAIQIRGEFFFSDDSTEDYTLYIFGETGLVSQQAQLSDDFSIVIADIPPGWSLYIVVASSSPSVNGPGLSIADALLNNSSWVKTEQKKVTTDKTKGKKAKKKGEKAKKKGKKGKEKGKKNNKKSKKQQDRKLERTEEPERQNPIFNPSDILINNENYCPPAVTFTLTWIGATSDLDLHTYEPDGYHVYYGQDNGEYGFLDFDDTEGFGPENYITYIIGSEGKEVSPNQLFRVRVNSYSLDEETSVPWTLVARERGKEVWRETGTFTTQSFNRPTPASAWSDYFELETSEDLCDCGQCKDPTPAGTTDGRYRVGDRNDPTITPDAGAGEYDSVDGLSALDDWLYSVVIGAGANLFGFAWPNAEKHLDHYLDNVGTDYTIDLKGMVNDVPSAKQRFEEELEQAKNFVETLKDGCSYDIASVQAENGYNRKGESGDWFYAIGGYSTWGNGQASISTDCDGKRNFVLDFEYKFYDRYNWDGGKKVSILGFTVTDAFMGRLHRAGVAKEFDCFGTTKVRVKWSKDP